MEWDWIALFAPRSTEDIEATGQTAPGELIRQSRGMFVWVFIELPAGTDPAAIDGTTIRLAGSVAPVLDGKYGFGANDVADRDGNSVPELRLTFDRPSLLGIQTPGTYPIPFDGRPFSGFSQDVTVK